MPFANEEDKHKVGLNFVATARGQYIIGKAIAIAIYELDREGREPSDLEDMRFLMEALYPPGFEKMVMSERYIKGSIEYAQVREFAQLDLDFKNNGPGEVDAKEKN